jgi:hypothetical protein
MTAYLLAGGISQAINFSASNWKREKSQPDHDRGENR